MAHLAGQQQDTFVDIYANLGLDGDGNIDWPSDGLVDMKDWCGSALDAYNAGDIQVDLTSGNIVFPPGGLDIDEQALRVVMSKKRALEDIYEKSNREGAQVQVYTSFRIVD